MPLLLRDFDACGFIEKLRIQKDSARDQQVFKLALESRASWKEFWMNSIESNSNSGFNDNVSSKKGTPFEVANFEAACSMANDYQCLEDVSQSELETLFCSKLKSTDVIAKKFVGEFGFDVYDFCSNRKTTKKKWE